MIEIALLAAHDDPRLDEVRSFLRAHNRAENPLFMRELETSPALPLAVVATTREGEVAGGLIGETRGRWLRINIMAVREDLRRRGAATRILEAAEAAAIARGCDRAYLETMAYQRPEFYEARGYARQCELLDWDSHGHAKCLYVKELHADPR